MKTMLKQKTQSEILERLRSLVWQGKHSQAINLVSHELTKPALHVLFRISLLELRVESYTTHGRLNEAFVDALAMESLAKTLSKNPASQAQALLSKGIVQLRQGNYKPAIKTIKNSLSLALLSNQKHLAGQSHLYLSQAYYQTSQFTVGIRHAQKAIAIFQKLADDVYLGRSYRALASIYMGQKQINQALTTAKHALELAQKTGDQVGTGNALNTIASLVTDLGESVRLLQRASQIFKTTENIERNITITGNLAFSYMLLGLYTRAQRLQKYVIETARAIGAKGRLGFELGNLIYSEILLGNFSSAESHIIEMEALVDTLDDPLIRKDIATLKSKLAFEQKDWANAIRWGKQAWKINKQFDLNYEIEIAIDLAGIYLDSGRHLEAQKLSAQATRWHRKAAFPLIDTISSQKIWWQYTKALLANRQKRGAQEALQLAHNFVMEGIRNIPDVGLRRNYLNKITENRDVLQYWVAEGSRRKLPKEQLYAHMYIESNTREPFARLTDTSQRLNLLKEIDEIQKFLVEEATELSGAERVVLIREDGKKLEVAEAILPVDEEADKVLPSIKKYLTSARLTRTVQLLLPQKQGLSRIVAPLIAQNQVVGYLYADMDSIYGLFDDTDRDMLGMLANQAAVALDNAGLVIDLEQKVQERTAQLQESVEETGRLLKESNTLAEVGMDISSSLDIHTVLNNIVTYAKDLLSGDLSALFLPESSASFRATAVVGAYAEELSNDVIHAGQGILGSIALSKQPEIVNDTATDPRALKVSGTELSAHEHLLAIPLLADSDLKGLMAVWRTGQGREFTQDELAFLENLSHQVVIALKNAQLFTEAEEARRVAEQANRTKSAFLANMSHELRTPLNSIINFTELVTMEAMGPVTPDQQEALGHSLSSSKHLLQLINDVLDISKIQAGKLSLFMEEQVDLHNLLHETLGMVEPLVQKQIDLYGSDIQLVRNVEPELPMITCDRRRLKQVLLNLLSNAIKFTEQGTITLGVRHQAGYIHFTVRDTGPGIVPELQAQIFEPFVQTQDGVKHAEGTGLGLPITKSLVEAHKGRLWLESTPGKGSAFFFTLPVK